MFLLARMQESFAQNRASEQAARVMAMQSANDNAKKLLEQLQLEYNKLRQQSITTELLDIVGGQVRDSHRCRRSRNMIIINLLTDTERHQWVV